MRLVAVCVPMNGKEERTCGCCTISMSRTRSRSGSHPDGAASMSRGAQRRMSGDLRSYWPNVMCYGTCCGLLPQLISIALHGLTNHRATASPGLPDGPIWVQSHG